MAADITVTAIEAISSTRVRFTFDRGMLNNAALLSAFNYPIIPITVGAATVSSNQIEPQNLTNPTFVDVLTSEMTDGATYEGTVLPGPVDPSANTIDPANDTQQYTGIGTFPGILKTVPISENRVDVAFDEPMLDNSDIRDPAKYTWDNGLITLSVLDVLQDGTVQLVTNDQTPGTLYELTVTP